MSAVHHHTSLSFRSKTQCNVCGQPTMVPPWACSMPLGLPVVPEVYKIYSLCSGSSCSHSHSSDWPFTRSCHHMSIGFQLTLFPHLLSTICFSTVGQVLMASSAESFRGTTFPRLQNPSTVIDILDSPSATLSP